MISGQTETTGTSLIDCQDLRCYRQTCCTVELINTPMPRSVSVSDSVLCLGRMGPNPVGSWKKQVQWFSETNYFSELNRIDGKPMEFEWKMGILNEIQKMMG